MITFSWLGEDVITILLNKHYYSQNQQKYTARHSNHCAVILISGEVHKDYNVLYFRWFWLYRTSEL